MRVPRRQRLVARATAMLMRDLTHPKVEEQGRRHFSLMLSFLPLQSASSQLAAASLNVGFHAEQAVQQETVVSVDGMFSPEAINTLKWIAQLLSEKWRHPCSSTFGCVKSCMSIAVVSATNLCLLGTRMKNHSLGNRRHLWDEEGPCRLHN